MVQVYEYISIYDDEDGIRGNQEISLRLIDVYGDDLQLTFLFCFVRRYANLII